MAIAVIFGSPNKPEVRHAIVRVESAGLHPSFRNPRYFEQADIVKDAALAITDREDIAQAYRSHGVKVEPFGCKLLTDEEVDAIQFYSGKDFSGLDPRVFDGAWKGQPAFVIGGGPSLRDFDWTSLEGRNVIAINRAIEHCEPDICFSMDIRFIRWIKNGNLGEAAQRRWKETKAKMVYLSTAQSETQFPHLPQEALVIPTIKGKRTRFSTTLKEGLGHGLNSGFGALNLAICMGADPIYLLGYDMAGDAGKQSWYHDGYPDVQPDNIYKRFSGAFEKAFAEAESLPRIVNLNPDSGLRCFEFGDREEALRDAKKRPIFCSYATAGTPYMDEIERLRASMVRLGLDHQIEILESKGSWEKNCIQKAVVIEKVMREHPDRPVVWVDADATVNEMPALFFDMPEGADFAVHYARVKRQENILNSGTLYFAPTDRARELVARWFAANSEKPNEWDQRNLQAATEGWMGGIFELPVEYCAIHKSTREKCENPIVEHFQASRKYKKGMRR